MQCAKCNHISLLKKKTLMNWTRSCWKLLSNSLQHGSNPPWTWLIKFPKLSSACESLAICQKAAFLKLSLIAIYTVHPNKNRLNVYFLVSPGLAILEELYLHYGDSCVPLWTLHTPRGGSLGSNCLEGLGELHLLTMVTRVHLGGQNAFQGVAVPAPIVWMDLGSCVCSLW